MLPQYKKERPLVYRPPTCRFRTTTPSSNLYLSLRPSPIAVGLVGAQNKQDCRTTEIHKYLRVKVEKLVRSSSLSTLEIMLQWHDRPLRLVISLVAVDGQSAS